MVVGANTFFALAPFFILLEVVEVGIGSVQAKKSFTGDQNAKGGLKALKINGAGFFSYLGQRI
ncbi:MAG: hypothetical protein HYW69_01890 [Candidatus Nealsonbacteria bacterium]|nr:hypothetical protein [Candidatus Nealsonbacteria bacterium]